MLTYGKRLVALLTLASFLVYPSNYTLPGGGIPGGTATQLQFNNSGVFGGVTGSSVDNTNGLVGLGGATPASVLHVKAQQDTIPAPTSFTVSQVAEQSNTTPVGSATCEYGPSDSSGAALAAPSQNNGSGSYFSDGSTSIAYNIYAYKLFGGVKYFNGSASGNTFTDNSDSNNFSVGLSWSAVSGADGYVITAAGSANNGNPNWSLDVGNLTSYSDDGAQSGSEPIPGNFSSFGYAYDPGGTAPTALSGSPSLNRTNVGFGNKGPANGSTWIYYLDSAVQISGTWYVSGSPIGPFSASDGNDSQFYDWDLSSWTLGGGSETDIIVKRSSDGGSNFEYFFLGGLSTSLTDGTYSNDATAAARWGQTYGGPPATITRSYKVYGYGNSPTNNTTWYSTGFTGYSATCNNDPNGYVVNHALTPGSRGNMRILGDYNAIGDYSAHYDTNLSQFYEGVSNIWSAGNTITPSHYGIQATGQTRYWRLFAQRTSPSTFYSSTYLQGSSTLPNDSNYYTFNVGWTKGTGSPNTKILESTNGSSYTIGLLSGSTSFVREANAPSFGDGTTVTPNTVDGTAIIAENAASTVTDNPQLIIKSTSSGTDFEKIEFRDNGDGVRGKLYNDGSANQNYWSSGGTHHFHSQSAGNFASLSTGFAQFNKTNNSGYDFTINANSSSYGFKYSHSGGANPKVTIGDISSFGGASLNIQNASDQRNLLIKGVSGQTADYEQVIDSSSNQKYKLDSNGKFSFGIPSQTFGLLNIAAGTTSQPPIQFSAGANSTSAYVGAMEFDGSYWYHTQSSNIRRMMAQMATSAAIAANTLLKTDSNGFLVASGITDTGSIITFSSGESTLFGNGFSVSSGKDVTMGSGARFIGGLRTQYASVSGTTSLNITNHSPIVSYTGTGGHTLTLPTSASINGSVFEVKHAGTGALTLATTSSQTIRLMDGSTPTSFVLKQGESIRVISDGSNWIALNQPVRIGPTFVQTATGTVANTVSETTILSTGDGSLTIPANTLIAGRTYRIRGFGFHSTSGTPTLRVKLKLGSTVVLDTGVQTSTAASNDGFMFEGTFTVRTTGASGTIFAQGFYAEKLTSPGSINNFSWTNTATTTIDTTVNQTIDVTAQWGTASASNTISLTNFTVEALN